MKYVKIGGQAVIEGVMMRNGDDYAVAVRKPDNEIEIKKAVYKSLVSRFKMRNVPILRGIFAFVDSLILGMSTLTFSASFYDEEEPDKKVEASGKGHHEKTEKLIMGLTVAFSIVIAVALFMVLPFFISNLFKHAIQSQTWLSVIEGLIRIALFLTYIILISRMKDIQRVFMYHGAEHKTINCIEHGEVLNAENAMKYSRLHKRCGTSFLLIVMIISVIFFIFIRIDNMALKVIIRILLVPVIAGVSYEIIQLAGRSESRIMNIVSKPGMWLQKLTTREPDESMLEVAIVSIEAIYDWKQFQKEVKGEAKNDL